MQEGRLNAVVVMTVTRLSESADLFRGHVHFILSDYLSSKTMCNNKRISTTITTYNCYYNACFENTGDVIQSWMVSSSGFN